MDATLGCIPLVELTRGDIIESRHLGSCAVVDSAGKELFSLGDPALVTFMRSAAKPFQALPLLASGAAAKFAFNDAEIAIACGSHSGTNEHVAVVSALQARLGISEDDLLCGAHAPFDAATTQRMVKDGQTYTQNRNNCSGKHTGMLALARHLWGATRSADGRSYLDPQSEVQQRILGAISAITDLTSDKIQLGIDGCSAPNFALPLRNAALGIARVMEPKSLDESLGAAAARIAGAMSKCPLMVAGPGRFDSALMSVGAGRWISKIGAEGYQVVGLAPGLLGPRAVGIALKVLDGDQSSRAASVATISLLKKLKVLSDSEFESLESFAARPLKNWQGTVIGSIRSCF